MNISLFQRKTTFKNTLNTGEQLEETERWVSTLLMFIIIITPTVTQAAPWDDMADNILNLLTNGFSRTIAIIVCIGLGFAAWAGKLTWGMAGRFIGGIVFIFGAAAIVDLFIDGIA